MISNLASREWTVKNLATGETISAQKLRPILVAVFAPGWLVRAYYRIADLRRCEEPSGPAVRPPGNPE